MEDTEALALAAQQPLSQDAAVDESWLKGIFAVHLFFPPRTGPTLGSGGNYRRPGGSQRQLALWRTWLAVIHCETQRTAEARTYLESLTPDDLTQMPRDLFWFFVVVTLGSMAACLEDPGRSQLLYDVLTPYSGRLASHRPFLAGPVDLTLGVLATSLGRYDDADGHFPASVDLCQRMEALALLDRTRRTWIRML